MSTHQGRELVADTSQHTEAVVGRQRREEVGDNLALAGGRAGDLGELGDDGRLVGGGQGGRRQEGWQLGIGAEGVGEGVEGTRGRVEGGGFGGGGVLEGERRVLS